MSWQKDKRIPAARQAKYEQLLKELHPVLVNGLDPIRRWLEREGARIEKGYFLHKAEWRQYQRLRLICASYARLWLYLNRNHPIRHAQLQRARQEREWGNTYYPAPWEKWRVGEGRRKRGRPKIPVESKAASAVAELKAANRKKRGRPPGSGSPPVCPPHT